MNSKKKESHLLMVHSKFIPFPFMLIRKMQAFLSPPNFRFGGRLVSVEENNKFRRRSNESQADAPNDLKHFVADIKRNFGLK